MSVWFCIPSARPVREANAVLSLWRERGYKIALWRDSVVTARSEQVAGCALRTHWGYGSEDVPLCDFLLIGAYPGYALAVNALAHEVLKRDPQCDWVVTGGDDIEPDPHKSAEEIALECSTHFDLHLGEKNPDPRWKTWGVMQPTGDRWADGSIDRICGSPWLGRAFCERAYGGNGPLWHEYFHMFVDEELQAVAIKLGCLWQRRDLTHMHRHWQRAGAGVSREAEVPKHLEQVTSAAHWAQSMRIFEFRRAAGFPGHEPLAAVAA